MLAIQLCPSLDITTASLCHSLPEHRGESFCSTCVWDITRLLHASATTFIDHFGPHPSWFKGFWVLQLLFGNVSWLDSKLPSSNTYRLCRNALVPES